MPIRWKVTTKDRESVIIHTSYYRLRYDKGTKVKAHKNTIGIAVFETRKQAEAMRSFGLNRLTLKVNGIGRGIKPKEKIPMGNNLGQIEATIHAIKHLGLAEFLRRIALGWITPKGTILYKEVEVLE